MDELSGCGKCEKAALFFTCHHVISPRDPAHKSFNNQFGTGLYGHQVETPIKVDYPTPSDAAATKQLLQKDIDQFNTVVIQKSISIISDSCGNMSIDVPHDMLSKEADNVSKRITINIVFTLFNA